ncbi:MAG: potassium-transporting ATPase subunit KdpC [Polyangiaceae bacterium]
MIHVFRPAIVLLAMFTGLTGVVYPLVVTGVAEGLFPREANGSLIERDGRVVGSRLLGQRFSEAGYFHGRPSATPGHEYNGDLSGGSNLAPSNPALREVVKERVRALRAANPEAPAEVPVDLVTASGSGLDPEISPAAADYQARRVARARGMELSVVRRLIAEHTRGPALGVWGEPAVNVLELNLALDEAAGAGGQARSVR